MSNVYDIIDAWNGAENARKEKNYAIAARLYRICHIAYNNGDLDAFNFEAECMGIDSLHYYKKMLRKVSFAEKKEILTECQELLDECTYSTLFLANDWRKFISDQYAIITQKYQEIENNDSCEHKLRNQYLPLYRKFKNLFI